MTTPRELREREERVTISVCSSPASSPDENRAGARSPLQPTGPQTAKPQQKLSPRGRPPMAPSSAEHARRLIERTTAVPIKRFDSADYFLSKHIDQQKAEAARAAMSERRAGHEAEPHSSEAVSPRSAAMRPPDLAMPPPSPSRLSKLPGPTSPTAEATAVAHAAAPR